MLRILLATLLAAASIPSVAAAQARPSTPPAPAYNALDHLGAGGAMPRSFRHFPGARYLARRGVMVFENPDRTSRVVDDLPRGHMVYAEPAGPGWLAVRGVGAHPYPQEQDIYATVALAGDRLNLPEPVDANLYHSVVGYVEASRLAPLQAPEPVPYPDVTLAPPLLWSDLGVKEPRAFVMDLAAQPFDAIIRLAIRYPADTNTAIVGNERTCTGFVVGDGMTVATAGHCFMDLTGRRFNSVEVAFIRGPGQTELIPATLVDSRNTEHNGNDIEDWAVLRLARRPTTPVRPLTLHDGALLNRAELSLLVPGFPGDLDAVARKQFGFPRLAAMLCRSTLSTGRVFDAGRSFMIATRDCPTWYGVSGAPVLAWNPRSGRWEIVAVEHGSLYGNTGLEKQLTAEALATVRRFGQQVSVRYGVTPPAWNAMNLNGAALERARAEEEEVPGIAALYLAVREGRMEAGAQYMNLSFRRAIDLAEQRAPAATAAFPALPSDGVFRTDEPSGWDLFNMVDLVGAARFECAWRCQGRDLGPAFRQRVTAGDVLDLPSLQAGGVPFFVLGAGQSQGQLTHLQQGQRLVLVGGDLFKLEPDGRIEYVLRDFFNLRTLVEGVGRDFKHLNREPRCPASPLGKSGGDFGAPPPSDQLSPANRPVQPIPFQATGVTTISAENAACLLKAANPPLVISSSGAAWGMPGAVRISWASAPGTLNDATQARLAATLATLTGGDKGRPLILYGDHSSSWRAYNAVLRVRQAGYANVLWVRGGLESWAAAGFPILPIRNEDDWSGRLAAVEARLAAQPKSAKDLIERSFLRSRLGQASQAIADVEAAMALEPGSIAYYARRGQYYEDQHDFVRAAADFTEGLRVKPGDAGLLNARCWLRATAKRELDKALADCTAAVAQAPEAADYLDSLALTELQMGRFKEAVRDFQRALDRDPTQFSSLYGLGLARLKLGQPQGREDIAIARGRDASLASKFNGYGLNL